MGFVRLVTPAVLGLARRNPQAGRIAYNALAGGARLGRNAGKALPYVGAGLTAAGAAYDYNSRTASGEDPGRAAFIGIGNTLGGFGGGVAGSALGPVGTVGGSIAGGAVGGKIAGKIWDSATGGFKEQSAPKPYTYEEQIAIRNNARAKRQQQQSGDMYDIAGFRYSQGVDPALAGMRMQQQHQNINAIQGYSVAKHLSNNELRGTLGQQSTDRYGMGQMNQTERLRILQNNTTDRYGMARTAEVDNRRTLRDERLGLDKGRTDRYTVGRNAQRDETLGRDQRYTERYIVGRNAQVEDNRTRGEVTLGLGKLSVERYGKTLEQNNRRYELDTSRQYGVAELGLRDRERIDKDRQYNVDADIRRLQSNNNFGLGAMGVLAGLYR